MGALSKTHAALESALIALGLSKEEAEFELRDFLIEEVSYVDRAANRRKFLVVKSAGGSMGQTKKNEHDGAAGASDKEQPMTLPTTVKEGLLRVLTEGLELLVSAVEAVKGAEETSEMSDAPVPEKLGEEIGTIADLLRGALSQYPSPMSTEKTTAAAALKALAESMLQLSAAAGEDGTVDVDKVRELIKLLGEVAPEANVAPAPAVSGELKGDEVLARALAQAGEIAATLSDKAGGDEDVSADTIAGVRQLAAMLNEIVEKFPADGGGGGDESEEEKAAKAAAAATAAKVAEAKAADMVKTVKAVGDAKAKLMEVLATLNIDASEGVQKAAGEVWGAIDALIGAARLDDILKSAPAAAPAAPPAPAAAPAPAANADAVDKAGRKISAARLKSLKGAVDALMKLIKELEENPNLSADAKKSLDAQKVGLAEQEKALAEMEKRLAEEQPQPDPARGPYGSIGTGGSPDDGQAGPKQEKDVEALADVMKRLDGLQKVVTSLIDTPDAPASRSEPEPQPVKKDVSPPPRPASRSREGKWVW